VLNTQTPKQAAYSTDIFDNELRDANGIVEAVIIANSDSAGSTHVKL
jgi:membrane fusion protein (multidrug efflux system)